MRDALANSYIPAVKTLRMIQMRCSVSLPVSGTQSRTDASQYGLSLTLGGGELTPFEPTLRLFRVAEWRQADHYFHSMCYQQ